METESGDAARDAGSYRDQYLGKVYCHNKKKSATGKSKFTHNKN